ncbi:metal ABC transporter permease [Abyssisolibacter fermentans]|uniref:metal ABC transporter permease n=1 Tax=Abyssisolibacter fermentans TaxID=1766203 RepID=UPI000834D9F3|nr:iron chelate uptake ABC transporter family permease subunit [Abyssisolibacter fermentans]
MIGVIFKYQFIQNAILAALFSSIICGIVGTIIVEKRLVNMSGGIAHSSFGGIGFGYLLGIEPIIPGIIFSILSALGIIGIKRLSNTKSDTLINMFWAGGMSLGILFINLTQGYPPDMTSYLFGDILTVSKLYVKILIVLSFFILFIISSMFTYWKAYLFDEEHLRVMGINILNLEIFLMIIIAISIVLMIKVVGIILVIALLTIPPAIAKLFTKNLKSMMIFSIFIGVFLCYLGLYLSYIFNIPSGATIILVSIALYLCLLGYKRVRTHHYSDIYG